MNRSAESDKERKKKKKKRFSETCVRIERTLFCFFITSGGTQAGEQSFLRLIIAGKLEKKKPSCLPPRTGHRRVRQSEKGGAIALFIHIIIVSYLPRAIIIIHLTAAIALLAHAIDLTTVNIKSPSSPSR